MRLLTFLLVFFPSILLADGFYLGAGGGVGVGLFQADYKSPINKDDQAVFVPLYVSAGYRHTFSSFSVSGELEYLGYAGGKIEDTNKVGDDPEMRYNRGSLKGSYSAHLLLGFNYSPTVEIFGRVGTGKTKYEIGAENTEEVIPFKDSGTINTTHLGLGARFQANEDLAIKVEYRYLKNDKYNYPVFGETDSSSQFIAASLNFLF